MSDMTSHALLQAGCEAHTTQTLRLVPRIVPLLQWCGSQLSLLEGDCVGLSKANTSKPGSKETGFFFAFGDRWQNRLGEISPAICISDQYNLTFASRSAFPITLTEDSAIAAAAIMGDSRRPKTGYSTPAAIGTPAPL